MVGHELPYIIALFLVAAASLVLAITGWHRRPAAGAFAFTFFMLGIAEWATCDATHYMVDSFGAKMFWVRLSYIGVTMVPLAWLVFAMAYVNKGEWWTTGRKLLFLLEPIVVQILIWTNDSHGLFWSAIERSTDHGFTVLEFSYGPFFWAHAVYSYGLLAFGAYLLARFYVRAKGVHRRQAGALLVASSIPWLANAVYIAKLNPLPHLDLTTFGFLASGLIAAWTLFRFRLLDVMPVALSAVIRGIDDGVIVLDAQNNIAHVNPVAGDLIGQPADRLVGEPYEAALVGRLEHLGPYLEPVESQTEVTLDNGEHQHTFELRTSPLHNSQDQLTGRLIILHDITSRKESEEALRYRLELEELLMTISTSFINFTSDELDAAILESLRLIGAFSGADRCYVYLTSRDSTMISNTHEWTADGVESYRQRLQDLPLESIPWLAEKLYRLEEVQISRLSELNDENAGEEHRLLGMQGCQSLVAVPIIWDRSAIGFVGMNFITDTRGWSPDLIALLRIVGDVFANALERRVAERELIAARDAAEASSRAKSAFLANMSHELRTPLNAVIGIADLMLTTDLDWQQSEYLDTIQTSAESLLGMVEDILDFSKIEAGRLHVESIPYEPRVILQQVVSIMRPRAARKRVDLTATIDAAVPATLIGDPTRLRQIWLNLTDNALKFTERGSVSLRATLQQITESEVKVLCSVTDTGIGIEPDKLDAIFESFSQADNSITRRFGGTGLGLTISRQLAEIMGGRLWAESVPGMGSTFHFTLEQAIAPEEGKDESPAEEPAPDKAATDSGRPLQVMVVEDNEVNRRVAQALLEREGHAVILAENGRIAVDLMKAGADVDLILMDVQMPEMDGYAATAEIRADGRWSKLPIVATTAHTMLEDREKCLAAGMNDFVSKPIRVKELNEALKRQVPHLVGATPDGDVPEKSAAGSPEPKRAIDHAALKEMLDIDDEMLSDYVEMYLTEAAERVATLTKAVEAGDAEGIAFAAHSLKGASATMRAEQVRAAAYRMEMLGRKEELAGAEDILDEIHRALQIIKEQESRA